MDLGPVEQLRALPEDRPIYVLDLERADHVRAIESATEIGLDLESDSFHHYREKVCLLQLSTEEADWLVDPLSGLPAQLARQLARTDRRIVAHAADNDVRALKRDFGLTLGCLFDTAVAARLLGSPHTGLKDLLEGELGVVIDKAEQVSDWSKRPLEPEQLAYAGQDVRWLLPLAECLRRRLTEVGRWRWLEEECERIRHLEPVPKRFDPERWRKVPAAKRLGARGRAVMAALWRWRESEAEASDLAPFRVAQPDQLAQVARVADAQGRQAIEKVDGFRFLQPSVDRDGLKAAVERGLTEPDPGAKRPPTERLEGPKLGLDDAGKERLARLRKGRDRWSTQLGIEPGFLLAQRLLERIAREAPETLAELEAISELGAWRVEALGREILDAVRL